MTYQLTTSDFILRTADNAFIPSDPANTDYRDYLTWLAEGNTPEPAPEPPTAAPEVVLTAKDRLLRAGLTVADLKQLLTESE